MGKGQAFLDKAITTSRGVFRHLNVVISGANEEQSFLVVPITTYRETGGKPFPGQDESCILSAGCHPFIKHKSYALYRKAKAMTFAEIFNGLRRELLVSQADMPLTCVHDLQRGAVETPFLPEEYRLFFDYFLDG